MRVKIDGREIFSPHGEHELRKIFPDAKIEVLTGAGHAEVSQDAAVPEPVREEAATPEEGGAEAAPEEGGAEAAPEEGGAEAAPEEAQT